MSKFRDIDFDKELYNTYYLDNKPITNFTSINFAKQGVEYTF
jgi:hypothetical protein